MATDRIPAPYEGDEVANLPVQVAVVVPSTDGDRQMSQDAFTTRVNNVQKWFDARFGGDTTIRGKGGYLADDELIEESVAIVEASMSVDTYKDRYHELGEFVAEKREDWGQDTVLYRIEDRVFIYPDRDYLDDDTQVPAGLIRVN